MSGSVPPADKASLLAPALILPLIAALDALRFGSVKIAVHEVRKDLRRRLQYSLFSDRLPASPAIGCDAVGVAATLWRTTEAA